MEKARRLKEPRAQAEEKTSVDSDSLKIGPRKAPMYTKAPVPETDTGGWVEYTKA